MVDGKLSDCTNIISGVPQGSVLGPLLFIVYVNDLFDCFSNDVMSKFFADDAKLYTEVSSNHDIHKLQCNIDDIVGVWYWKDVYD